MDYYYKLQLRKTCSGLGFYLFTCFLSMIVVPIIFLTISIIGGVSANDNINLYIIMSITSLACLIIPGFIYCKLSKTSLQKIVPFQKIKFTKLMLLVSVGFGMAFIGDYVAEIFIHNMSLVGISNKMDMDYTTYSPLENMLYILSVAVVPAISEEFALRGIVLGKLRQFGDSFAVIISAVLFAVLHGNIVQIPFAFILGLVFGFIVIKTNTLLPTIIIHFLNNFYAVVISIMESSMTFTYHQLNTFYSVTMFIIVTLAIISAIILSKDKTLFNIKNKNNDIISFKTKITNSFTSVGMVFFLGVLILEIISYTGFFNYG